MEIIFRKFDNDTRGLRLHNHVQQTEYNGQDHPSTSSDPGGAPTYNPYQSFISGIEITW